MEVDIGAPKYPVGTTFEEYFEGTNEEWYKGKVVARKLHLKEGGIKRRMCEICYDDGDMQDLYDSEIHDLLRQRKIRKLVTPSAATNDLKQEAPHVKEENTSHKRNAIMRDDDGGRDNPIVIDSDTLLVPKEEDTNRQVVTKSENITADQNPRRFTDSTEVKPEKSRKNGEVTNAKDTNVERGLRQNSTTTTTTTTATVPIKEETKKKFAAERKERQRKYGDRFLLHRHNKMGIARLGGNLQNTFVYPRLDNPLLQIPSYPTPKHLNETYGGNVCSDDYGYCAFNTTWQPNGPMFAGQTTASLEWIPYYFLENRLPFPLFMKRTMTGLNSKSQGALLGWEYVGNYRSIHNEELPFWESANNIPEASKKEIAKKTFESSLNENGYGRRALDNWRDRLIQALEDEQVPYEEHSIAARCLKLKFRPDMPDKELSELAVNLDEYYIQYMVQFDHYDERIYDFCVGGKTSRTKDGKMIKEGSKDIPAKAQDWYDFANRKMLFKY